MRLCIAALMKSIQVWLCAFVDGKGILTCERPSESCFRLPQDLVSTVYIMGLQLVTDHRSVGKGLWIPRQRSIIFRTLDTQRQFPFVPGKQRFVLALSCLSLELQLLSLLACEGCRKGQRSLLSLTESSASKAL
jgi:hypothetical protein